MTYSTYLREWGHALLAHMRTTVPSAPTDGFRDRILPMVAGMLDGHAAVGAGNLTRARTEFLTAAREFTLMAFHKGDPELRVLDLVRQQRQRYLQAVPGKGASWLEIEPQRHFGAAISQLLSVTLELDSESNSWRRVQDQAADAANYILFFLASSGVALADDAEETPLALPTVNDRTTGVTP